MSSERVVTSEAIQHLLDAGDAEEMRRLPVISAHYLLGPFGANCDLPCYEMKAAKRGGSAAKKRGVPTPEPRLPRSRCDTPHGRNRGHDRGMDEQPEIDYGWVGTRAATSTILNALKTVR